MNKTGSVRENTTIRNFGPLAVRQFGTSGDPNLQTLAVSKVRTYDVSINRLEVAE
jgi:hypothetical protein